MRFQVHGIHDSVLDNGPRRDSVKEHLNQRRIRNRHPNILHVNLRDATANQGGANLWRLGPHSPSVFLLGPGKVRTTACAQFRKTGPVEIKKHLVQKITANKRTDDLWLERSDEEGFS